MNIQERVKEPKAVTEISKCTSATVNCVSTPGFRKAEWSRDGRICNWFKTPPQKKNGFILKSLATEDDPLSK